MILGMSFIVPRNSFCNPARQSEIELVRSPNGPEDEDHAPSSMKGATRVRERDESLIASNVYVNRDRASKMFN